MRQRPYLIHDADRHGWSEATPHMSERARRRSIVAGFFQAGYWPLMMWLRADRRARGIMFFSLDEAVRFFNITTGDPVDVDDALRARYVAARYFNRHLHARGSDGRPLMGREWL